MPEVITGLYDLFRGFGLRPEWAVAAGIFVVAFILINFVAVFAGVCTYAERKVAGRIQARVGPYVVGPYGLLQWVADALKLLLKEDIVPEKADRVLFRLAPLVVFGGSFVCWVALPFGPDLSPALLNIGILYIIAFGSSVVLGILMAGWSSGNKWALFGAMRSAAQIVSYEIPAGLTILAIVLVVGSLNMHDLTRAQVTGAPFVGGDWHGGILSWHLFRYLPFSAIAAIVLYTCALAETNRVPFDIPEAESELVAGYHTEYTGFRFSVFFLAEYANMFVVSAVVVTLFLGGWLPPFGKLFDDYVYDTRVVVSGTLPAPRGGKVPTLDSKDGWRIRRVKKNVIVEVYEGPLGKEKKPKLVERHVIPLQKGGVRKVFELREDRARQLILRGDKVRLEEGRMVSGIWLGALLGDWGPAVRVVEGVTWFMLKSLFLVFVMMWIRWTIPRYRVDQLMDLCWKRLTPLAFINLVAIGVWDAVLRMVG